MNKKQVKLLEGIKELQENAEKLLATKQVRIADSERVIGEELEKLVRWKVEAYLEEDSAL